MKVLIYLDERSSYRWRIEVNDRLVAQSSQSFPSQGEAELSVVSLWTSFHQAEKPDVRYVGRDVTAQTMRHAEPDPVRVW